MLTRRITYRLYPSTSQLKKLFYWRRMHAYLFNAAVANRKTQYQKFNHSVDYFEQQASLPKFKETWIEYKELNAGSLQATLKRVDFAFKRFFQRIGGYPKFRSIRKYSGWIYPDSRQGFKAHTSGKNGYLELTDMGCKIQMRGQARTWGKPTTCTVVYRSGKWLASITVKCNPVRETGKGAIGLDFGCKTAIANSDGNKIESPKFLKNAQQQINRESKNLRRKRKPERRKCKASRAWKKAQSKISKLKKKVANKRQNWIHHQAVDIVRSNSLIATEKLNLKGMTRKAKQGSKMGRPRVGERRKTKAIRFAACTRPIRRRQKAGLNRSMLDVGIGMLKQAIVYKAKEAGAIYLEAPTKSLKPTQRCSKCWSITKKTLNDKMHVCSNPKCNHVEDRDVNSAQVCLIWASGATPRRETTLGNAHQDRGQELSSLDVDESSSTDKPKVKYCGGYQQLAQTKHQKLAAQSSVAE